MDLQEIVDGPLWGYNLSFSPLDLESNAEQDAWDTERQEEDRDADRGRTDCTGDINSRWVAFSRVALSRVALSGVALSRVALSGVVLSGVALSRVAFSGVAFTGVAFSRDFSWGPCLCWLCRDLGRAERFRGDNLPVAGRFAGWEGQSGGDWRRAAGGADIYYLGESRRRLAHRGPLAGLLAADLGNRVGLVLEAGGAEGLICRCVHSCCFGARQGECCCDRIMRAVVADGNGLGETGRAVVAGGPAWRSRGIRAYLGERIGSGAESIMASRAESGIYGLVDSRHLRTCATASGDGWPSAGVRRCPCGG